MAGDHATGLRHPERVVELCVPYPMGFFAKQIGGRLDDPNTGWKGRGLWVTSGKRTPVHIEGLGAPAPGAPGATANIHRVRS
jgi:hypothetical protein